MGLGLVRLPRMWLRLLRTARLWLFLLSTDLLPSVLLSAKLRVWGILSPTRIWLAGLGLAALVVMQPMKDRKAGSSTAVSPSTMPRSVTFKRTPTLRKILSTTRLRVHTPG
jgi:hypothetical protein